MCSVVIIPRYDVEAKTRVEERWKEKKKDGEKSYRYRLPAIQWHRARHAIQVISNCRLPSDICS